MESVQLCSDKSNLEIHQTRTFMKKMQTLHKAGKNERAAAQKSEKIIAMLQADPLHEEAECKRTKHGELRLKDCRKYDLACGFRLICLKRDDRLIFTYIGSHDECHRWIENNRDNQDELESTPIPLLTLTGDTSRQNTSRREDDFDEYEENLMAEIDEKILRTIFAGLAGNGA
ncbi:MAG: hypothetical protein KQH63_02575 [Desulfobulbaceae bacterium]|nr:hypothetical protein [Desulfobulbaceae bacterium]